MAVLKCKMCGGNLEVGENEKIATCLYCGSQQTVPTADNEKKVKLYNRANTCRLHNEFDMALSVYQSIVSEFPHDAEAYWGLCLCKYGIEYVDDPKTGDKIPTCHRTCFESILDDSDYKKALELTDPSSREIYVKEAQEIDRLQKDILAISQKEEPYDIFICYKETDEKGERTPDSVIAQDIYSNLTDKGYKVFFSRITLESKIGSQYEPIIFAALRSARVMLAIGTNPEYFGAVWVKNEWSRYLSFMKESKDKYFIPCYKNMDAYDMPKEFQGFQSQNMEKIGFLQDLVRGIDKIFEKNTQTATSMPAAATDMTTVIKQQKILAIIKSLDGTKPVLTRDLGVDENQLESRIATLKSYRSDINTLKELMGKTAEDDSVIREYESVLPAADRIVADTKKRLDVRKIAEAKKDKTFKIILWIIGGMFVILFLAIIILVATQG